MADTLGRLGSALADRYHLRAELGRGGMATVYLAEDLRHHRPVAIKVLKPELAAALGPARFLREIDLSAHLTHPHILPLHDSGEAGDLLFYVMPFMEGESVRGRLRRERQLPLDDALLITREVADALSYAHARGVIHRDIKPENILLESGHAVVADFGIAKAIAAAGDERLTETGLVIGTPAYMSPEQATGSGDVDERSDQYSLGCVLYEMLSGETPYTGPTPQAILGKKLSEPLPQISVVRKAVPEHVQRALAKALASTAADRFPTIAQFAEAIATPERVALRPPRRWSWKHAVTVGLASVVLVGGAELARRLTPGSENAFHPRTSIAVLPFQNLSAEGPYEYFAGGLHDELLTQLASVATLKVISRTSVMQYAGRTKPLREIANELTVGTIVEGTVQVLGDRLRVSVQLIDAATDEHLWAQRYDRTLEDAFAIQSDIAQRVAAALGAALGGAGRQPIPDAPTPSAEAYDSYLRGRYYLREWTAVGLDSAAHYFARAIAQDSSFAAAFAQLSAAYVGIGGSIEGVEDWYVSAEAAATRAIQLDSSLAEAWWALARTRYSRYAGFRHEESVRFVHKAISLNPSFAEAHQHLAFILTHVGMLDRAEQEVRLTKSLNPLDHGAQFRLGQIALARGEYDVAAAELARIPIVWVTPYLAEALVGQGRLREALDLLATVDTTDPDARVAVAASIAAVALAHLGESARAMNQIRRSMADLGVLVHAHHVEYNIGVAYAVLGENEMAIEWFRRAAEGGFPCLPAFERPEFLGSLRSDPGYAEFLADLREESTRIRRSIELILEE